MPNNSEDMNRINVRAMARPAITPVAASVRPCRRNIRFSHTGSAPSQSDSDLSSLLRDDIRYDSVNTDESETESEGRGDRRHYQRERGARHRAIVEFFLSLIHI